jgi:hypothetical protein
MTVAATIWNTLRTATFGLAAVLVFCCPSLHADPPATSYIFPAGGQLGSEVTCRVGTLNCAHECEFHLLADDSAAGILVPDRIARIDTLVLEGPYHQNPIAQRGWDYPKDMSATLRLNANARPGVYHWYCSTSEGATVVRPFVVGDLPEVLEDEERTTAGRPQLVTLPVTVNGRMFPRADLDEYRFTATAGEIVSCEVVSHRLGHKLDARLQLRNATGRLIAEADDHVGPDSLLITTIPNDGEYVLRIHDIAFEGGQDFVYRLSVRTGPCVTHIYPAGASQALGANVRLYGVGLSDQGYVDRHTSWSDADGWSMPEGVNLFCPFQTSEIAEIIETEPSDETGAEQITLPVVINGRVQKRGEVDAFHFTAAEGEAFVFEVFGRRLTSPITTVVTVHDSAGEEVARHEGDGLLRFEAAREGDHTLRISELFRETHAGDEYIYRVVARQTPPDFELRLNGDNPGIEPGATANLKLQVTRVGGFDGEVRLSAESLAAGVTLDTTAVAAESSEIELSFTAAADAPIGVTRRARIVGTAVVGESELSHAAVIAPPEDLTTRPLTAPSGMTSHIDTLAVTVTHPQVFAITTTDVYGSANRGATLVQTHHLERLGDFKGAVEISLSDGQDRYLQGVTGPVMTLQPGETDFDYPVFLPEAMDLNRTARMVVMGTARVIDSSGREHDITHRTKNQMVVRVCPSLLTLDAGRAYFEGAPGSTLTIPLRVGRTGEITGDVTLGAVTEDDSPIDGLPTIHVPPETDQVEYHLQLAADASPGQLYQLQLRATGLRKGYPAVAETTVEIQVVEAQ